MHITRYTDYALRVLIYLAHDETRVCTIREIAERYGISRNHLMKVVQDLNTRGFVQATRGKHGGLRLNQPAETIRIGAFVRAVEQDWSLVECMGSANHCIITPVCALKRYLSEALDAFFVSLDQYTLADLIRPADRASMQAILQLAPFQSVEE